jgi:hypothetical protein
LHGHSRIGSETHSGQLDLVRIGDATPLSLWYTTPSGANLDFYDEALSGTVFVQADGSGSGGFLNIRRNTVSNGFVVDGNHAGTGDPQVAITGASRSASFDMSVAGNASVALRPMRSPPSSCSTNRASRLLTSPLLCRWTVRCRRC